MSTHETEMAEISLRDLGWVLFRLIGIPVALFLVAVGFFVLGEFLTGRCPWW